MMMEVHIVNANSGETLKAYALGDKAEIIVGRDDSCDISIMCPTVSREHCVIEQQDGTFLLRDLKSTSGTYKDGEAIDEVRIEEGLEVKVGPTLLRFHDSGY
ncbi:MAG: FHA domain-containing protein [Phycisphaerales bacterium]|nr:FHA domain-containing protein [Phycisphaerales bacterium]|tara:strand:+ start:350 stop:655 length:306 start_codon:yes stop_codon:yes gene_type:complete